MSDRVPSAVVERPRIDRPTDVMTIVSVLMFDEPVDWNRAQRIIRRRLVDRHPRLRQRIVEHRVPLRAPKWEWDPEFTLEQHVRHVELSAPGGSVQLQELVSDLMTMPLDRDRPLWQIYMVDGFGEGAALIGRMHNWWSGSPRRSTTVSSPRPAHGPRRSRSPERVRSRTRVQPACRYCARGPTSPRLPCTPAGWPEQSPATAPRPSGSCWRPRTGPAC